MEEHILDAPVEVDKKLNYAGFWIRFAAYFIDVVILWLVNIAIAFVILDGYSSLQTSIPLQLFSAAMGIAYFVIMESSARQATIGKMAVGVKVGNAQGGQITFANALGRYFAKILSALILLIGFIMAGWDNKKQALHDKLAKTYVYYA
jgi:uncharacterized RDD family membrane protein YckC